MTGECERCGGPVEWKNAAGHFRDVCEDCANAVAQERIGKRHKDRCDDPDCATCNLP